MCPIFCYLMYMSSPSIFNLVFTGTVTELVLHTVSLFYLYVTPFDQNILQLVLVSYINNLDYCVTTPNYQMPSFVLSFANLDVEVDFINTCISINLARKLISCKFSISDDTCPTCTGNGKESLNCYLNFHIQIGTDS